MSERILIVDDDVDSLKLIGLMLQRQGYEVLVASTGQQALAKAKNDRPDLIILDIMMPDMDGYEVCRRLRHDPTTQPIPIIMFTARAMVDDKVAGFEAGADDYLTKPTHPAELASRIKAILARSAAQNRAAGSHALTVGFIGAKGGLGTTTLAVNVAAALGQNDPTILTDFRPGVGTIGLSLGFGRSTGIANLLSRPASEITPRAIENEIATHNSGLRLLLSSARPKETLLMITPDSASMIVRHLRTLARNVVVDLGPSLTRLSARILQEAELTVLTVEPTRIGLTMANDLMHELDQIGISESRISIVLVNRAQSSLAVPWQEAEKILNHPMTAIISPAPEVAFQAAEAGVPIVLFQPNAIVASQFTKLAEEISTRSRVMAGTGNT
ncbi:MAG TPA: response regulator [Aggregatilinea sp.]|jgi:pilus assembly protein CpaE|uniref:response regulator n=1 Tax=Aggregatilinea sp. TaxID=2806333 RepID=UPI002B7CAF56|nr:response regulator [Aggregatilinea sp.]HML20198.1 response regulator [Aggregatilinea sp.]